MITAYSYKSVSVEPIIQTCNYIKTSVERKKTYHHEYENVKIWHYIYRSLTVLQALGPHLRNRCLHHLQSLVEGQLQLLCLFVKLEQNQGLQQAVHLLCRRENLTVKFNLD